jgi:integrase
VTDWADNQEKLGRSMTATRSLIANHVIPNLGTRILINLSADDIDAWTTERAEMLVTSTIRNLLSILRRSIKRAQSRGKVKNNVALLCDCPVGKGKGRPSKALTLGEAINVLNAAEKSPMYAYIVTSLLTGARTEEMRPLTWDHVDLTGKPEALPPVPPNIRVWRSVRFEQRDPKPGSRGVR